MEETSEYSLSERTTKTNKVQRGKDGGCREERWRKKISLPLKLFINLRKDLQHMKSELRQELLDFWTH